MELVKDYDCSILYHSGKSKADALSRKSMGSLAHISPVMRPLIEEVHKLEADGVQLELGGSILLLAYVKAQSSLVDPVKMV